MDFSNRYQAEDDVTFQKLEDATVIVHLGTGRIHHTNATGSRIWELLGQGRSLSEILESLLAEFDVPPDELKQQIEAFVTQLCAENMIRARGDAA